jgi:hypothetical protein
MVVVGYLAASGKKTRVLHWTLPFAVLGVSADLPFETASFEWLVRQIPQLFISWTRYWWRNFCCTPTADFVSAYQSRHCTLCCADTTTQPVMHLHVLHFISIWVLHAQQGVVELSARKPGRFWCSVLIFVLCYFVRLRKHAYDITIIKKDPLSNAGVRR